MMEILSRIEMNPDILMGKPVIKGTRISVELILRKLSEGMTIDQIIEVYPHVSKEDVFASLTYASEIIANEEVIFPKAS